MRLLLCGDFACHTGFARVNERVAGALAARGWDVAVLAVNYVGMPHPLQLRHRLYPAAAAGDAYGKGLLAEVVRREAPDAILVVNDPWIVAPFLDHLPADAPPVVAYMPVDAPGINGALLAGIDRLAHAVAYTDFGLAELRRAGLTAPASVIPHGVDVELYRPIPRAEARGKGGLAPDVFAVLVADANQPRKRLDIAVEAFARFAADVPAARLLYHGPATSTGWGYDIADLADQHGVGDRLILTARISATQGVAEEDMPYIYALADVKLSTSAGEGWGLTTMEAMACGVPCVAADWAALGEWAKDAVLLLPVGATARHTGGTNTRGAALDPAAVADALAALHASPDARTLIGAAGLARAREPQYRWETIGAQFDAALRSVVETRSAVAV